MFYKYFFIITPRKHVISILKLWLVIFRFPLTSNTALLYFPRLHFPGHFCLLHFNLMGEGRPILQVNLKFLEVLIAFLIP